MRGAGCSGWRSRLRNCPLADPEGFARETIQQISTYRNGHEFRTRLLSDYTGKGSLIDFDC